MLLMIAEQTTSIPGPASALLRLNTMRTDALRSTAWKASVGECTGPEDGYVYGGDAARVLTFVRRGRSNDGGGGFVDYPSLPEVLRWTWTAKRDRGVLSFKVAELETRRDTGVESGWECIFASNFGECVCFARVCLCSGRGRGGGGGSRELESVTLHGLVLYR